MTETRETSYLYAVSSGDGNDGVSRAFPEYYVRTNRPHALAELALISLMQDKYRDFARENVEVNGDPDGVSAYLNEGPNGETAFGQAWLVVEVFHDDGPDMDDPWRAPVYDSLEDCFGSLASEKMED